MRILVTGGRAYDGVAHIYGVLDVLAPSCVIHGCAGARWPRLRGADTIAGTWARENDVPVFEIPADWDLLGRRAGPIRNQRLLDEGKPDLCIAFDGGAGTRDMVRRAEAAGVLVLTAIRPPRS